MSNNTVRSDNVIQLNENSRIPIYQQVFDGLVQLIIMKVLSEGEQLPSVRELALMLKINPNTIQKAYKALENDGFIVSIKGKGNFVSHYDEIVSRYKSDIEERLEIVLKDLITFGETKESIIQHVSETLEGLV